MDQIQHGSTGQNTEGHKADKHSDNHLYNLEQIINQSDSIVYIRQNDVHGTITYISENISGFGYSAQDFYQHRVMYTNLIYLKDIKRIDTEILFATQQKKSVARLEYRIVSKNEEINWVSDVLQIIYDQDNRIKQFQGIFTNISHRKDIEDKINSQTKIIHLRNEALNKANLSLKNSWTELQIAHSKLTESEEKFKIISDQALLGIIIIQDGLIKYYNKTFISLISYPEDDIREWKKFEFLNAIHEEDKELVINTVDNILKSNDSKEFHFEFRRITKNNEVKWMSHWSKAFTYEGKKAALVTLLDIDEQKKWQDALKESESRLRTKLDFILSPEKPIGNLSIKDLFDLEQLQKMQDSFALSHNIASIITDVEGVPITRPSNFNKVCKLVRSSQKGNELCQHSDKLIGQKSREFHKPFSTYCLGCGFLDAGAPIIVGGNHIANWMIGQAIDSTVNETKLKEFAAKIGIDKKEITDAFHAVKITDIEQFNKTIEFLWTMAGEISALGYNNLKLARDIEDRKKIEIALRESEELYRQLVHTSPDGIALVDLQGNMQYISPKAKQLFGYPTDYNTEGLCIFNFIEPSYLDLAIANVTNILEKNISLSGIYAMVKKDGSTFSAEVNSTPIKDYFGNTKGMISIIRDITERKKFEKELIAAKNKAEESDQLKSAFLANMSHEIRTPMNGILGFANLLNEKGTTTKQRKEYADIINQNGNLLLKLIDDILDLAKIEAGQLKIFETHFFLDQIMYKQYMMFKTLLDKEHRTNIKLKLTLPENKTIYQIKADQARLNQVLTNLLSNAIKFTHQGYVEFGYEIASPDTLKLFVKDTGIGLSSEKTDIIFDRFRQAEESGGRRYGGTGLGLTISSNLVRLMDGKIWVDSEINKGSNFYFTIPLKPLMNEALDSGQQLLSPDHAHYNWHNKNILIAEDEHINYLLLREILKTTNVNLMYAKNGEEAIQLCRENNSINLVLMDLKMPKINGYTATREIKKLRPKLPVVAQSAYAMEEEIKKCKEAGCDDYISKPIDHQRLLLIINGFFKYQ